jgi:N-acetylglucosaminylphosphatidylinositol deacetylase
MAMIHVLVIAHPDDESMFFVPTIQCLLRQQQTVWLLCLTNGNYNGLGKVREKELVTAGKVLGVHKTIIQENAWLQDHPTQRWDKVVVAASIQTALTKQMNQHEQQHGQPPPDDKGHTTTTPTALQFVLITFDQQGISGHVNHIDTYLGVCHLMEQQYQRLNTKTAIDTPCDKESRQNDVPWLVREAWQLYSEPNIIFKYLPVVSWILVFMSIFSLNSQSTRKRTTDDHQTLMTRTTPSLGTDRNNNNDTIRIYRSDQPGLNWRAMAAHHSQFVWYRRLFVMFSCYTYCNKLILIHRNDRVGHNQDR